jgi:hypothetical protein
MERGEFSLFLLLRIAKEAEEAYSEKKEEADSAK